MRGVGVVDRIGSFISSAGLLARVAAWGAAQAAALCLAAPLPAGAFSVFYTVYDPTAPDFVDLEATLLETDRWAAEPVGGVGLHVGIRVGVEPGFASALGVLPEEVPLVREAVAKAFEAWENEVLSFDVQFEADFATTDYEITLTTYEGDVGFEDGTVYGMARNDEEWQEARLLTNGQRHDGWVITHSDIEINAAGLRWFREEYGDITTDQGLLDALQKLVMHESGHSLGFAHPTAAFTLDDDFDPTNALEIDPLAPWTGLFVSPFPDSDAIMSGLATGASFESLFNVALHPDDAAARDALYPVAAPEPGGAIAAFAMLGGLGWLCGRRAGSLPTPGA